VLAPLTRLTQNLRLLAQILAFLGYLPASNRGFRSKCWAHSQNLGPPCGFYVAAGGRRPHGSPPNRSTTRRRAAWICRYGEHSHRVSPVTRQVLGSTLFTMISIRYLDWGNPVGMHVQSRRTRASCPSPRKASSSCSAGPGPWRTPSSSCWCGTRPTAAAPTPHLAGAGGAPTVAPAARRSHGCSSDGHGH
jgi:hypothetical protein